MSDRKKYLALRTQRLIKEQEEEELQLEKQRERLKNFGRSRNARLYGKVENVKFIKEMRSK